MFEQIFKNIDEILYKNAGADNELDYIEQTSWILFLRYLDHLESEKAYEAALEGRDFQYIVCEEAHMSEIVAVLNERFGTEFEEADKRFFDQIETELMEDKTLQTQAKINKLDTFSLQLKINSSTK